MVENYVGFNTHLRPFFEVLVLALDGLKVLKNCGLKIKKVLVFRRKRS